jgi:hypothetical protein
MPKSRKKRTPKRVLGLPDLEQAKSAVLNSLSSLSGQRTHDHATNDFVEWYCSEPRLAFKKAGHIRTVPIPQWVKTSVDVWSAAAGITGGAIFRSINKSGEVWGDGVTPKVLSTSSLATREALSPESHRGLRSGLPPRPDFIVFSKEPWTSEATLLVHDCYEQRSST